MEVSTTGLTPPPSLWKKNIFSTRDFRQVKFIALKCRESPHLAKTLKVFQFQFSISKQKPFKSTSCHSILHTFELGNIESYQFRPDLLNVKLDDFDKIIIETFLNKIF